jgi:acetyltransferase
LFLLNKIFIVELNILKGSILMNVHNLDSIFKPKRIAIVGISSNPNSVSGKVLTNIVGSGFRGVVYPINPDFEAVMAMPCFSDLKNLPQKPDLVVICSSAEKVPEIVRECGDLGINGIIIMSAGFKEIGEKGLKLENDIKEIKSNFSKMRIIGPNCLGIIIPKMNLNVSFAPDTPKKGNIAFISQSGALCTSVLDWAKQENIGFSNFVSIGNTIDVDYGDLIDYFGEDEETKSILLYIESITNSKKFMTATRAFARTKPIIVYKAGRFPESAAVAASHTGALASADDVYDAAFQRTGLARVYDIGEIFDCAELIGRNKIPNGPNLAIVTNAGGPGVMATDALIANKGSLAKLSEDTLNELNNNLPEMWSHANPVDVLGDAKAKRITKATKIVLADKNVDAVLVILTPQAMTNPTNVAKAIGELQTTVTKPILASWIGGYHMKDGMELLNKLGIASYKTPEQAVRAFMTLVNYSKNLETLYETPKDIPVEFSFNRKKIRKEFGSIIKSKNEILSEETSKKLLASYDIPVTIPKPAISKEEAVKISVEMGYPVVFKILSEDITHKSDVGGVILNINNDSEAEKAFDDIINSAGEKCPDANVEGVTVQSMVTLKDSIELILGIKKDPIFGTVILVGAGGITAELFADRSIGFPPLNERLARRMLEELKIWKLLKGYRGKPAVNIDKLIETMIRLSYLAADYPEIVELDINPLVVNEDEVMALDARIVLDLDLLGKDIEKYSHLALRPYPEEMVSTEKIQDQEVILRPIKPEDEPMWLDLLGSCSKESIYSRFRYFFQWSSHEVATRYCYIDYDREIAIVAEIKVNGKKQLVGVGRLISDPEHNTVEYAILITDEWQNKDLGRLLTDYCMDIAKNWGLKKIVAQTTSDNHRMISLFKHRGFEIKNSLREATVEVEKIIN